ncbi:hypothetical protein SAMN05660443_2025 [Marinospirillum celere]|uniref:Uncharacterized protein n=1 Tax=Marinospirillum celere TaxID=1122252 RepID=A0A1I1HU67_9GAMM|nr:hypothetical protein [Marinospirillum celere]SFC27446.1 hypothetical protein SAMN05660443_2025 [Marinospirillum celere]
MKRYSLLLALLLAFGLFTSQAAFADQNDSMTTVDESSQPENLALPDTAAPEGQENAQQGLDTANQARERGREFGQERAEEARSRGQEARERGKEARQQGQEARQRGQGPSDRSGRDRNPR